MICPPGVLLYVHEAFEIFNGKRADHCAPSDLFLVLRHRCVGRYHCIDVLGSDGTVCFFPVTCLTFCTMLSIGKSS